MQYILVIVFFSSGDVQLRTERFNSLTACEAVAEVIVASLKAASPKSFPKVSCTRLLQ